MVTARAVRALPPWQNKPKGARLGCSKAMSLNFTHGRLKDAMAADQSLLENLDERLKSAPRFGLNARALILQAAALGAEDEAEDKEPGPAGMRCFLCWQTAGASLASKVCAVSSPCYHARDLGAEWLPKTAAGV